MRIDFDFELIKLSLIINKKIGGYKKPPEFVNNVLVYYTP
jgi:hypothetical protein